MKSRQGFTLAELIFVLFIIAVLTVLAIPRFTAAIEYSRSMEAFANIGAIRKAMDRCNFMNVGKYIGCDLVNLDIGDPNGAVNAHFSYTIADLTDTTYMVTATRNTLHGGDGVSAIVVEQTSDGIERSGTGIYENIK